MPALDWTDDEIAELAAVSGLSTTRALAWWQKRAPRNARNALANGEPVSRRTLDAALAAAALVLLAQGKSLQARDFELSVWQLAFADEIIPLHLASGAAAVDGIGRLTLDATAKIEERTRSELGYLRDFALGVAAGEVLLGGLILQRSAMYAEAGRATYHSVEEYEMGRNGFDQEMSIRNARDSCPGCLDQEAKGWQPIGRMIPIGHRDCLTRCKCSVAYRNSATGEEKASL